MTAVVDNEGITCRSAPTCALCSAPGTVLYSGQRDPLFGSPGIWSSRRCSNPACGVIWLDPMPEPDSISALYTTYHTHQPNEDTEGPLAPIPYTPPPNSVVKKIIGAVMPWWRHYVQTGLSYFAGATPGLMLDVGCGAGAFMREAIGAGWNVVGIDFDEQAVAVARRVQGAEVHVMDVFDSSLDDRKFNGIMLDNVIEHLPDTGRVMARCAALLAPGGRLVMITPNADALCHDLFREDWRGLETPRHLCIFSGPALQRAARENGFPTAHAFCSRHPMDQAFMVRASSTIAQTRGKVVPAIDMHDLEKKHRRAWWRGKTRGEFLILVAHKPG
jgi:SAM-dependent methyltransferase